MDNALFSQLTTLFQRSGEAHSQAFQHVNSVDLEWPMWYADYLYEDLKTLLGANFTKSELIYLLVLVDKEQRLHAPGVNWTIYYSRFFLQRYQ
jgi:hypothetical protein